MRLKIVGDRLTQKKYVNMMRDTGNEKLKLGTKNRGENLIVADFLLFVIVCELAAIYDNQKNAECGKEQ